MPVIDHADSPSAPEDVAQKLSSGDATATAQLEPAEAVDAFRVLDEEGKLTATGRAMAIDMELAKELYSDMTLARRMDHEALALQRQGQLHLWLMSWGQEAAQVGSIRALRDSDSVFPSYREHAAALCRGISPSDIMRQWRGLAHSGWDPTKHRFHINSLVLASQTLHATGYAAGVQMDQSDEVVMTYFGDGSTSQGDLNEALNWAAAGAMPILFFCQNNQWAISTPTTLQMKTSPHVRASGFGLHSYHVDGNDALAVHAVTQHAASRVRAGQGPAFIEAQTYRLGGHSSSDDPKRYRHDDEIEKWQAKDPIKRLERFLRTAGVQDDFFTALAARAEEFADDVRAQCTSLTGDDLRVVFDHTYADPHPVMHLEQARYLERRLSAT